MGEYGNPGGTDGEKRDLCPDGPAVNREPELDFSVIPGQNDSILASEYRKAGR